MNYLHTICMCTYNRVDVRLQAKPEFVPYQTMYCDTDEAIAFHCLSARYCEASEAKENINSDILISRRLIKRFCKPRMNLVSSTPPSHKGNEFYIVI